MVCSAVGEPEPSVQWWLRDPWKRRIAEDELPLTKEHETPGRVRVLFEHVAESDAGRYTCRAVSEGVWLEQIVELVVVPAVPSSPPVIYTEPDTEAIT